ncbi:MAG: hypothetical protein Ct9H300mP28_02100 [Pseudomonadota bacterium]|nr:MAG: hypothetical protein Ct9H300mP28_02100 [Pseudomonadota bacterium]
MASDQVGNERVIPGGSWNYGMMSSWARFTRVSCTRFSGKLSDEFNRILPELPE